MNIFHVLLGTSDTLIYVPVWHATGVNTGFLDLENYDKRLEK